MGHIMGKITGFIEIERAERAYLPTRRRIKNFDEFVVDLSEPELAAQAARCMDCGIPYCHTGCPVNNIIPDWNDLVYRGDWKAASEVLHSTNNFPEFTGRVCPAPCETACTLYLDDKPVTIKTIEHAIVERAWRKAGFNRKSRPSAPKSGLRLSAPARPGWPAPSNWRAPATKCCCTTNRSAAAACYATASRISNWTSA